MSPSDAGGRHYGQPLEVRVKDGALEIRVGVEVLAHAVRFVEWANRYDDARHDYFRSFAITDPPVFAKEVMRAMLHDREDGSSPLSDFLDKMTEAALDDGAEGAEYDQSIRTGEASPLEQWDVTNGTKS